MPSQFKGIRLSDEDLAVVRALIPHYVDVKNDTQMMEKIFWNGLLLTAAQANVPNVAAPLYGGFDADALAAQLERVLLPSLDFLFQRGRLALLQQSRPPTESTDGTPIPTDGTPVASVIHLGEASPFVDEAAEELDAFGTDFLG